MSSATTKPRIAWWHRFGPAEQTEMFHALPQVIAALARNYEVHFYGGKNRKPIPEVIRRNCIVHELPFATDRSSPGDIKFKFLLYMLCFPFMALHCRFTGVRLVHIEESVPLFGILMWVFYGGKTSMTVADIYSDIYLQKNALTRFVGKILLAIDLFSWKKLALIITRAKATKEYLVQQGIAAGRILPVYDPCEFDFYHPLDRNTCKREFGFAPEHFVMVCHGILHPNKGVDRLIRATAELKSEFPQLRLLIAGDGNERPKLAALVRELGADDIVKFTGWLPDSRAMNRAINAGEIGVIMRVGYPSDHFHITGGLTHNMCAAVPSFAVRLRGISEVVAEGETGFLFAAAEDMAEFKQKLKQVISDPARLQAVGRQSYAYAVKMFSTERITRITAGGFDCVVQGKSLGAVLNE
jgi:glycosyltransferase involved in cell wall biosynthesis